MRPSSIGGAKKLQLIGTIDRARVDIHAKTASNFILRFFNALGSGDRGGLKSLEEWCYQLTWL